MSESVVTGVRQYLSDASVVLGYGSCSSAGIGSEALWNAMLGRQPHSIEAKFGHLVPGRHPRLFSLGDEFSVNFRGRRMGAGASALGITATAEALRRAGMTAETVNRLGAGKVFVGSGVGNALDSEKGGLSHDTRADLYDVGHEIVSVLGLDADWVDINSACSSGLYALQCAGDQLSAGLCDWALVIGADGASRVALYGFERIQAVDYERCRPFSDSSNGASFGEGAAALLLAREFDMSDAAIKVLATGISSDAGHLTAPDPTAGPAMAAIQDALDRASLSLADIAVLIPHGTGTRLNDAAEEIVLKWLGSGRNAPLPMYSLKALIGHTGGASGLLGVVAAIEVLAHGFVPSNVDVGAIRDSCRESLRYEPTPLSGSIGLVNAYGFGGSNASTLVQVHS